MVETQVETTAGTTAGTTAETTFVRAQAQAFAHHGLVAETRQIEVQGRNVSMLVAGDGPPVVVVNGLGTPAATFAPLMAELPGYTLFAVDWPGHGLSDPDPSFASDLERSSVDHLVGALDQLGLERVPVIANSFGSWAATRLVLDHASRVGALVHLGCPAVVLDTSAPLPMRLLSAPRLARLIMKVQPPSSRQVRQLSKMVGEYPLDPEIADVLLAAERQPGFERSLLAIVQTLLRLRGSRPEHRLSADDLARVEQPTLLVFGARDPFGAAAVGERMAAAMPDARLHLVDTGHAPWLRESEVIGRLATEFLTTVGFTPASSG